MRFSLRMMLLLVALVGCLLAAWQSYRSTKLRPGDLVDVTVIGTLLGQDISGILTVDEQGRLPLGPAYGKVKVEGMNVDQATVTIETELRKILREPEVSVVRVTKEGLHSELARVQAENYRLQAELFRLKQGRSSGTQPTASGN